MPGTKSFSIGEKFQFSSHRLLLFEETKSNKNERKTTYNETKRNKAQTKQTQSKARMGKAMDRVFHSYFIQIRENNIIEFNFVSDSYLWCNVTKKIPSGNSKLGIVLSINETCVECQLPGMLPGHSKKSNILFCFVLFLAR